MKYHHGLDDKLFSSLPSVFILGAFDGLHIGHLYLLQQGQQLARSLGMQLTVMAFSSDEEPCLTPPYHKRRLFERLGVDVLIDVPLTQELKDTSAEAFIGELQRMVFIHTWVGGTDLRFGKGREGSCDFLARRNDMKTVFVERLSVKGEEVSSTRIRQLVALGDLAKASSFLGRPYSLMASATHFDQNGYTLDLSRHCLPPDGDYAATLSVEGQFSDRFATIRIGTPCLVFSDEPISKTAILEVTL